MNSPLVLLLPTNVRLDWKVIARYKHSSLLGLAISKEGKKFYNTETRMPRRMDRSTTKYRKCCDASTIDIVSYASVFDDRRISDDSSINVDTDSAPQDDGKKST